MGKFDFSGWATRNDLLCADGRTIRKNAFEGNDGDVVPLVWNHDHKSADNVLGHALLENRSEGVYAYCTFNDTDSGIAAKKLVKHGDVRSLSIYANKLKQIGGDVIHGSIKELSLVLAGANPGAKIDFIMAHGEDEEDSFIAEYDEYITLYHSDDDEKEDEKMEGDNNEKTVQDIIDSMTEEQKNVMYAMAGLALEHKDEDDKDEDDKDEEGDEEEMKHNLFENEVDDNNVLTHADEQAIMNLAKSSSVGSWKEACKIYAEQNDLAHGVFDGEVLDAFFPDYKDVYPGEPETLTDDQTWVGSVISGVHKSPVSRVRTRQIDARNRRNRAKGYKKGKYKEDGTDSALLSRTTDPQTVYVKDKINRDDMIDFTDFDMVNYQWKIMRQTLNEEIATAILIGDGREEGEEDKIQETHIRSIWNDEELYTIHTDVDIEAAKAELQGAETDNHFGENYIYAEAIINASLYAREQYKGSGNLKFYCTPHILNIMLLARDLNGRRIYSSKADLQAALNVSAIETVEQFEGLTRKDSENNQHELLGMYVNLADYQVGSTKGGEITKFEQFDIDFNQHKMLLETRISGALTRVKSAIVLEKPVQ